MLQTSHSAKLAVEGLTSKGLDIPVSRIRDLANRSMGTQGIIPLWFGETDTPTPDFIRDAAVASLAKGATFYSEGLGKPWLREAIARYMSDLHSVEMTAERVAVTASGSNAVNLAFQMLLEPGDRVLTTLPSFPTLMNVPALQSANLETLSLKPGLDGWQLDMDELVGKLTHVKVLLLNSPNNPTGWMLGNAQIARIVDAARKTGTWIVSDEVYARIVYEETVAPSFAAHGEREDRIITVNSFSKSWAMTGWRLGWLTMPASLTPECEKLMEFSMSCAPEFIQAGGLAAIEKGEDFIKAQQTRLKKARDLVLKRLGHMERVTCIPPDAAFYAFMHIDGVEDDMDFAADLVRTAQLGIAPGSAFDPSLKGWFRICFAKENEMLQEAMARLQTRLETP